MQVKYNKKAIQQINSTIDYYLEHFGKQATTNLAHEIDEKVKMLRKYPGIGFRITCIIYTLMAKPVPFYTLDVIISVGYRVKSQRGSFSPQLFRFSISQLFL